MLCVSINMSCLVCCRTVDPTKNCFLPETELKTMLPRARIVPLIGTRRSSSCPSQPHYSQIRPIMEMVSKWHQVIPWWLPTVLLSHNSRWLAWRISFKYFLQRGAFGSEREHAFLTFKFTGIRPWQWPVVLDRYRGAALGLNCLCSPVPTLRSDCFLIIGSVVWEEEEEHGLRASRQCPRPLRTHWDLMFALHWGPDITPAVLPFHLAQNVTSSPKTSAPVDCCSCVYSLVGFLFMNVGWEKYSDLSLRRGGA